MADGILDIETAFLGLELEQHAAAGKRPFQRHRMAADRCPTRGDIRDDLQPPQAAVSVFVDNHNGDDVFHRHRLPDAVQSCPRTDIKTCVIVQVDDLRSPNGQRLGFPLPRTIAAIHLHAVAQAINRRIATDGRGRRSVVVEGVDNRRLNRHLDFASG